ncbi:MAG TPA: hypothetical protein VD816_08225 [Ohtaekwangia sp.]|nr:hypothetical protein [Ohtaekwangia sp.]
MLLKYLLILGLLVYVFYKIGSFFFRAGAAAQQLRNMQQQQRQAGNGQNTKAHKKQNVKGGEYVDYEEVK